MRFPEFSKEWEKATLQSVATLSKGTGISKDQLSEEGQPCILYGELYTKYNSEIIDTIISKTDIDPEKLVRSQANDVIIPCSGESAVDIATSRCVKQSKVLLGGDLNIIRLKGEHDGSFFAYQLNGKRKYDIAKVAQGVSVVHLYGEHLKRVMVNYPSATEQKKISSLLALIDQRIETQRKIIEDLKKLKDAINNSLHHNIKNYQIFSFNELGNDYSGLTGKSSDDFGYGYPYISYLNVFRNNIVTDGHFDYVKVADGERQNIVQHGDLLFTLSSETPCEVGIGAIYLGETYPLYLNSFCFGVHLTNREHIFRPYLAHFVASQYFRRAILPFAQGSTRYNLMKSDFMKHKFCFPSFERQKEIHNALHALSVKIQNEEVCLNRYSIKKQYLLTQMFI